MGLSTDHEVTQLLKAWRVGDEGALEKLTPLVYRAHFFAISAQLMRRILIDFARSRGYVKRGGAVPHISLEEAPSVCNDPDVDLVALDDALKALSAVDQRKSKVVELKFFGGLSVEETAEVLRVSSDTVVRDWRLAKIWLLRELSQGAGHEA